MSVKPPFIKFWQIIESMPRFMQMEAERRGFKLALRRDRRVLRFRYKEDNTPHAKMHRYQ